MDAMQELTEELAFFDEMEKEFDTMKNENKKLEEILFFKEQQLRQSEEMISSLEKEIEKIFEFGIGILSDKEKELNDAKLQIVNLKKEIGILSNKEKELENSKKTIASLEQKIAIMDIKEKSNTDKNAGEKGASHEGGENGSQSNDPKHTDGQSNKGKNHKHGIKYLEALTDMNESLAQLLLENNMDKDDSIKLLSLAHDKKSNLKTEKEILDAIKLINRKYSIASETKSPMPCKTNGSKRIYTTTKGERDETRFKEGK